MYENMVCMITHTHTLEYQIICTKLMEMEDITLRKTSQTKVSLSHFLSFVKVAPTILKIKTRETRKRRKIQEANKNRVNLESIHNDTETI